MFGRFALATGGLFVAFAGWAWLHAETAATRPLPSEIKPATYYAIDVSNGSTTIDLAACPKGPCDLIISSLDAAERTIRVRLSSDEAAASESCDLHAVADSDCPGGDDGMPFFRAADDVGAGRAPPSSAVAIESQRERGFHLHVADTPLEDPRGYTRISARLVGEGREVRVYRDAQATDGEIAAGLVDAIIEALDMRIIPRSRSILGVHRDVDGDGKLAVLLTPWLGRLQGGRTAVNGFVRSDDFRPDGTAPYGNRCDVLYLNSTLRPGDALVALLAHEYTHAACCGLRLADGVRTGALPEEEDWLNEGIAHVAERLHGAGWSNLERRVRSYLEHPERAPLVVPDYYRAGLWRDDACRGATYLFLQWCTDRFGAELLHELAVHPLTGAQKLEAVTGHSFEALYRHWTIAVHRGKWPSLDLHDRVGGCRLDGPRMVSWDVSDGPCELELHGTATAFVRHTSAANGGTKRITIAAPRGARLQVTIVRPVPRATETRSIERPDSSSAALQTD